MRGKTITCTCDTYPLPLPPYPFRVLGRHILAVAALLAATPANLSAQVDERVIYASVVDKDGSPALDLTAKDFIVREDGQSREVLRVARDTDPLQIALLVDNSTSMRNGLSLLRKSVAAFVDATRDENACSSASVLGIFRSDCLPIGNRQRCAGLPGN